MFKHIIIYPGRNVSLALMQEEYMKTFVPWPNQRVNIEGTLQRPPYSLSSGIEWVRGLDKRKGTDEVFAILAHTRNKKRPYRYIGHTGIHHIAWPNGTGVTGSIIGEVSTQGKGYGTEAKLLLQYHAFRIIGLRKLLSDVKDFNAQSLGHLIKCGYKIVGRRKEQIFHDGRFVDEILLEVFRSEWEEIWEKYQKTGTLPSLSPEQRKIVTEATRQ